MEGFLIRLPANRRGVEFRRYATLDLARLLVLPSTKNCVDLTKPQLLYYVLEEGFLRGYISPLAAHRGDEDYIVESLTLTGHEVEIETYEAFTCFKLITYKTPSGENEMTCTDKLDFVPDRLNHSTVNESISNPYASSDENDSDFDRESTNCFCLSLFFKSSTLRSCKKLGSPQCEQSSELWLFADDRGAMKGWATSLLNWNRFVFHSVQLDSPSHETTLLGQAKFENAIKVLEKAFAEKVKMSVTRRRNQQFRRMRRYVNSFGGLTSCFEHKSDASNAADTGKACEVDAEATDDNSDSPDLKANNVWWNENTIPSRRITDACLHDPAAPSL